MKELDHNQAFPDIQHLIYAMELRDNYTQGHSQRVAEYALILATLAELDDDYCHEIYIAGLLHDIGKIGIPDAILLKPGKLEVEEYKLIQEHGSLSGKILQKMHKYRVLTPIVRHHHEDYNGCGYPDNLKAENIPLGARVLSIVDVFDALTTKRIYRGSMSIDKALQIMHGMQEKIKFDPRLYDIFIQNFQKFSFTLNSFRDASQPHKELQELDSLRNNFFFTDPLTKLFNREGMLTILKKCSFNEHHVVLGKLDIESFREYNNLYGTDRGDVLLQKVAKILKAKLKATTHMKEPELNDMFVFRPQADIYLFLSLNRKVDFLSYKIDALREEVELKLGVKLKYELLVGGKTLIKNIEKQISSLL